MSATWNEVTGTSNHIAMMEVAAQYTEEQCHYVINDCQEAMKANPEGHKAGHYADEIAYAGMRLANLYGRTNALSAY